MECGLYLYGIFPEPGPTGDVHLKGLDSQAVHSQTLDGFTFLYSEARQEKYLASRRNLFTHEKVLEQVMSEGFRTLLPLRFGLVVKSWDIVAEQLIAQYQQQLKELFAKLEGHQEVSIKVFWDSQWELQALMESNQELKQQRNALEGKALSMDEVVRIGQLIETGLDERKLAVIEAFRSALNSLAVEVVESEPMMEGMIYNAAYLISWNQETLFSEWVESLDLSFNGRLRIRYNNFTAPYTFAQIVA